MVEGKGRFACKDKPSTPVRVKIKRLERKEKTPSSPWDVKGTGRPGNKVKGRKEKPEKAVQTRIDLYLNCAKAGNLSGAAEKVNQPAALRRKLPLGGFGSQGNKGDKTPSRKSPSHHKVGRVFGGKRKEERKGQETVLEKWLTSRQEMIDTDPDPDPGGRQNNFEKVGKSKERKLEGRKWKGRQRLPWRRGDSVPEGRIRKR